MLQNVVTAFKDWKTTVPSILLAFFGILQMAGGITLPVGIQTAITFLFISVIGIFSGSIADLKTTIIGIIAAVVSILGFFNIVIPMQYITSVLTLVSVVFGLFSGQPIQNVTMDDAKALLANTQTPAK